MALQLRRLTPADLEQVVALEYKLFPREFCYSVAKTQEILAVPHVKGKNYSVGAFDGDNLVGYILMFDAPSELDANERVALVWELAIMRRYIPLLSKLFMQWIIREAHHCGAVIESRLRERTALRMLKREHAIVFSSYYRVTHMAKHQPIGEERMIFFRFEPTERPLQGLRADVDALAIHVERLQRALKVMPLRIARRVCYAFPERYVPLWLLQLTYLAPRGTEPVDVRSDIN